jgi:hypothetical protein
MIPNDGDDIGRPKFGVSLTETRLRRPLEALNQQFPDEFTLGRFVEGIGKPSSRLRGIAHGAPKKIAESARARDIVACGIDIWRH